MRRTTILNSSAVGQRGKYHCRRIGQKTGYSQQPQIIRQRSFHCLCSPSSEPRSLLHSSDIVLHELLKRRNVILSFAYMDRLHDFDFSQSLFFDSYIHALPNIKSSVRYSRKAEIKLL